MTIWIVLGPLLIVPVWDWAALTRLAAYYTDFDYRHWPMTRLRLMSVLLLVAALILVGVFATPGHPPLWPLLLAVIALAAWAIIAVLDVNAQRRTGYRNPPRYSDRE